MIWISQDFYVADFRVYHFQKPIETKLAETHGSGARAALPREICTSVWGEVSMVIIQLSAWRFSKEISHTEMHGNFFMVLFSKDGFRYVSRWKWTSLEKTWYVPMLIGPHHNYWLPHASFSETETERNPKYLHWSMKNCQKKVILQSVILHQLLIPFYWWLFLVIFTPRIPTFKNPWHEILIAS